MEEYIALTLCRWLFALAGIGVGVLAYMRATRKVDVPNQLLTEVSKLKADMKSLTTSVEQAIGAFEDRFNSYQKRQAAYASGPRRSRAEIDAAEAQGEDVEVHPVGPNGPARATAQSLAELTAVDPKAARDMISHARRGR